MFLTFSALIAINAFAPHYIWTQNLSSSRSPSSLAEDELEEHALKEKQLLADKKIEDRKKQTEDTVRSCTADTKKNSLDQELQKLLADKEAILKELAELKNDMKIAKGDTKTKDIKNPKIASVENNSQDLIAVMSNLTSFMLSQQEYQMSMMTQMFSMMAQPRNYHEVSPYQMIQQYTSPYAFSHSNHILENADYSMANHARNIGLRLGHDNIMQPQDQNQISGPGLRIPSQDQMGPGYQLTKVPFTNSGLRIKETQLPNYPMNHEGFDFSNRATVNFERSYIN